MSIYSNLKNNPHIKVIGVGKGGINILRSITELQLCPSIDFIAVDSDVESLAFAPAKIKIKTDEQLIAALYSDNNSEPSQLRIEDFRKELRRLSSESDADMVFIAVSMGDNSNLSIATLIAQIAKEDESLLTIGVCAMPFEIDNDEQYISDNAGSAKLLKIVDTMISIPYQQVVTAANDGSSTWELYKTASEIAGQGIRSIIDILILPSFIGIDFISVRSILQNGGAALLGIGEGAGAERANIAAMAAIKDLSRMVPIKKADGILFNITAASDLAMIEIDSAAKVVFDAKRPNADILFGAVTDEDLSNSLRLTLIATGISGDEQNRTTHEFQANNTENDPQLFAKLLHSELSPSELEIHDWISRFLQSADYKNHLLYSITSDEDQRKKLGAHQPSSIPYDMNEINRVQEKTLAIARKVGSKELINTLEMCRLGLQSIQRDPKS